MADVKDVETRVKEIIVEQLGVDASEVNPADPHRRVFSPLDPAYGTLMYSIDTPEPYSPVLMLTGVVGLALLRRWMKASRKES